MASKVRFGLSNVHVAFVDETDGSYETPVPIPGAVTLSRDPEGENEPFYADNITYYTGQSNQGYTGELEMALIPPAVKAEMLGWIVDEDGGLVEVANGEAKPFALLFELAGNDQNVRFAYYKVTASRPSKSDTTKTNSTTPTTEALPITIVPVMIDDEPYVGKELERSAENAAVYDAWYEDVVLPSIASA